MRRLLVAILYHMTSLPRGVQEANKRQLAHAPALARTDRHVHDDFVYLVAGPRDRNFGLVKIGYAGNVEKRLKNLQGASPIPLEVYRTYLGGVDLEDWLHRAFRKERAHGEWFKLMWQWDRVEAEVRKWQSAARSGHGTLFRCDRRPCPAHPTRWG